MDFLKEFVTGTATNLFCFASTGPLQVVFTASSSGYRPHSSYYSVFEVFIDNIVLSQSCCEPTSK